MYQCILFDLDGTLTDSGEGIMRSVQYALDKIGYPEPDLDKLRVFVGPPLLEQFMAYAGVDADTARHAITYYRERYAPIGIFENELYPGIGKMLLKLQQMGYRLGVASSKPELYVIQILEHFGIRPYFEVIVGSELNGNRTTKSEVIEEALRRLNLTQHRDQVLMVGDREHDVLGARQSGLECIAVSYGYGPMEELEAASPLKIVRSPEALVDFFRETPLRKMSRIQSIWRDFYPVGIHFVIGQVIATFALMILQMKYSNYQDRYLGLLIRLTAITDLIVMVPAWILYKGDQKRREYGRTVPNPAGVRLGIPMGILLLVIGAACSFYGNLVLSVVEQYLDPMTYGGEIMQAMEGQNVIEILLWVGVVAPVAEEMIFRWLVYLRLRDHLGIWASAIISAVVFAVYHGNVLQGIYTVVLGLLFAYVLEMTGNRWSCVLMHIGANSFSAFLSAFAGVFLGMYGTILLFALAVILLTILIIGMIRIVRDGNQRGYRAI